MRVSYDTSQLKIDEAMDELMRRINIGVSDACEIIERDAVARCPEGDHEGADTVSLAHSIAHRIDVDGDKVTGTVGTGLDYAVYVHEGTGIRSRTGMGRKHDLPWSYMDDAGNWHTTSGMEANPFLEDAFEANRTRAEKALEEAIRG